MKFKNMLWTHILVARDRNDLNDKIKQFQIDNPRCKIKDIKYSHSTCLDSNSPYAREITSYSVMIIYK